jgi:hypothetical protein
MLLAAGERFHNLDIAHHVDMELAAAGHLKAPDQM